MTKQYYVHRNRLSAPIILVAGAALYMVGEILDYRSGMPSYILQALGMVLTYWAVHWIWQNENLSGSPAIGMKEVVWTLAGAIVMGAVAELNALWDQPLVMVLAQGFAMLALVHLFVALGYLLVIGKDRHWWYDERGYMTWASVLMTIVLWFVVAGVGTLLASSHVWLFQSIGKLIELVRWWLFLAIPLMLIVRWVNHKMVYKKYAGLK